jgi:hypothetical protein
MISRGSYEFSLAQGAGRGFEYCREVLGIAGKSSVELRMAAGFGGPGKQGLNAGPRFAETMEFVPTDGAPKFVGIYRPIGEFEVAALEIEPRFVDVSDWGDAFASGEREQLHLDDAYEARRASIRQNAR